MTASNAKPGTSAARRRHAPTAAMGRVDGGRRAAGRLLLETLLGGFSPTGASTNTGWFALIVALMCIPFGGLLLALGVAKWLRNRRIAQRR